MYANSAPTVAMIAVATASRPAMPCGSACDLVLDLVVVRTVDVKPLA